MPSTVPTTQAVPGAPSSRSQRSRSRQGAGVGLAVERAAERRRRTRPPGRPAGPGAGPCAPASRPAAACRPASGVRGRHAARGSPPAGRRRWSPRRGPRRRTGPASTSSGGGPAAGRWATTAPKDWPGRDSVTVVSVPGSTRAVPVQAALATSQPRAGQDELVGAGGRARGPRRRRGRCRRRRARRRPDRQRRPRGRDPLAPRNAAAANSAVTTGQHDPGELGAATAGHHDAEHRARDHHVDEQEARQPGHRRRVAHDRAERPFDPVGQVLGGAVGARGRAAPRAASRCSHGATSRKVGEPRSSVVTTSRPRPAATAATFGPDRPVVDPGQGGGRRGPGPGRRDQAASAVCSVVGPPRQTEVGVGGGEHDQRGAVGDALGHGVPGGRVERGQGGLAHHQRVQRRQRPAAEGEEVLAAP